MLKQTSQREKIASPSLTLGLLQWVINSLSLSLLRDLLRMGALIHLRNNALRNEKIYNYKDIIDKT